MSQEQAATSQNKTFLPTDLLLTDWHSVSGYYDELLSRSIANADELMQWLRDRSELDTLIGEDYRWRYVNMTRDTKNAAYKERVDFFHKEIDPKLKSVSFQLNKKLVESPFIKELDQDQFMVYLRGVATQIQLYREENLPLFTEMRGLENEYGSIVGDMSIEYNGQTYTLQQAAKFTKSNDRAVRKEVFELITERRLQDKEQLDALFDKLLALRHKVALNCGFDNYRDYKFAAMGRFDYTPEDCFAFHESIEQVVVPMATKLMQQQQAELGLDILKPWDTEVEPNVDAPLQPFETSDELVDRSVLALSKVDAAFGELLVTMRERDMLDLESRAGKAPGGYNMTMPKTGLPFIFMNAAGTDRDVKTMVHEAGHAVHSKLSHPLELAGFKKYPSEVAELASMSMELFTMPYWDAYYDNTEDLKRSQINQLTGIVKVLRWIACIDQFQHWIYTNPGHTAQDRKANWLETYRRFHDEPVDWSDNADAEAYMWQRQLHLFEVPFYYIEYGFAQLGAVAMWRQYQQNPEQAIANYQEALKLGYTKTIPQIYERAGISFRFDEAYIQELMDLLWSAYEELVN